MAEGKGKSPPRNSVTSSFFRNCPPYLDHLTSVHESVTNYFVFLQAHEVTYGQPMDSDALLRAGRGAEAALGSIDKIEGTYYAARLKPHCFTLAMTLPGKGGFDLSKRIVREIVRRA